MYEPLHHGNTPVFAHFEGRGRCFNAPGREVRGGGRRFIAPGRKVGGRGRPFIAPGRKVRGRGALKGKGFGAIAAGLGVPLIMLLTGKGRKRRKHNEKRLKGRRVLSILLKMIGLGRQPFRAIGRKNHIAGNGNFSFAETLRRRLRKMENRRY